MKPTKFLPSFLLCFILSVSVSARMLTEMDGTKLNMISPTGESSSKSNSRQNAWSLPTSKSTAQPSTIIATQRNAQSGRKLPFALEDIYVQGLSRGDTIPPAEANRIYNLKIELKNQGSAQLQLNANWNVRLTRAGAVRGQHLHLNKAITITLNPNTHALYTIEFRPADIPDLGFNPVSVDVYYCFTNIRNLSWGTSSDTRSDDQQTHTAEQIQTGRQQDAGNRLKTIQNMYAQWRVVKGVFKTYTVVPQVESVKPKFIGVVGADVTVSGRDFGSRQGARKIELVPLEGGRSVNPVIKSWDNNKITFSAPPVKGEYLVKIADVSPGHTSNGISCLFGVKKRDITLDLNSIFGGTGFDTQQSGQEIVFYVGSLEHGLIWLSFRTSYSAEGPIPPILNHNKMTVKKRVWSPKKNTYYDVRAIFFLIMETSGTSAYFEGGKLVIRVPFEARIEETVSTFYYNNQKESVNRRNAPATDTLNGMLTIRLALDVETVGHFKKIVPVHASVDMAGNFAYRTPYTDKIPVMQHAWNDTKQTMRALIAENFTIQRSNSWKYSVFANHLYDHIQNLLGGNKQLLEFKILGPRKIRVFYF